MAVNYLHGPNRQVKLLLADVRPHIVNTDVEVWIAGKTHPDNVKERGQSLVGNLKVNVFQMDDIADIFVCIFHHRNLIDLSST